MSNEVNNLASSFVAMAQAFEKLPIVQAELDTTKAKHQQALEHIQALQIRLIDRANELDAAHAATRKMEVERDHAETMFLETDDKLGKAKDVLNSLVGNASAFIRAVEPPKPEPTPEPVAVEQPISQHWTAEDEANRPAAVQGQSEAPLPISNTIEDSMPEHGGIGPVDSGISVQTSEVNHPQRDPIAAPSWATPPFSPSIAPETSAVSGESVASSSTEGSVPSDPTSATTPSEASASDVGSAPVEAVASPSQPQPKPFEGKRYTDVPFYVSLVEWLNGGGTEEAYYAK